MWAPGEWHSWFGRHLDQGYHDTRYHYIPLGTGTKAWSLILYIRGNYLDVKIVMRFFVRARVMSGRSVVTMNPDRSEPIPVNRVSIVFFPRYHPDIPLAAYPFPFCKE